MASGNFCTWNPLRVNNQTQTFREGNTRFSSTQTGNNPAVTGTFGVTSGKWYWEIKIVNYGNASNSVGVCRTSAGLEADTGALWNATGDVVFMYLAGGNKRTNGSSSSYGNSWTTGDILQVALDMDNGAVYFGKNNTFQNSGDPTSGSSKTGASFTNLADKGHIQPYSLVYNNGDQVVNFGQDDTFGGRETASGNTDANSRGVFKYAPPTGYLALCSANLPISADIDPAQTDDDFPQKQFNVLTYTGNGSTQSITGLGFMPDLCWIKDRSSTANYGNGLIDSSRGRAKALYSHDTRAELSSSSSQDLTSFDSDGFSLANSNNVAVNTNGQNYVAWAWRCNGGTTASNSDGSVTSTVQVNTKSKFSIVQWNGTGSAGATVGHGLGAVPKFIIVRNRDSVKNWACYHVSDNANGTKALLLNSNSTGDVSNYWNGTQPTSSVFSLGTETEVNQSSNSIVAYCWADVDGMQKFSNYTGNGDSDGAFIYTGFRPRMIFLKRTDSSGSWHVFDSARNTFNPVNTYILWDSSSADDTASSNAIDFLSNGFKIRNSASGLNANGSTYVFGAWADVSYKYNQTF